MHICLRLLAAASLLEAEEVPLRTCGAITEIAVDAQPRQGCVCGIGPLLERTIFGGGAGPVGGGRGGGSGRDSGGNGGGLVVIVALLLPGKSF